MSELPAPLVPAEVDLHGFPGFMLNVDRLLSSELVALGNCGECWAALMLWCRAWKQTPPGSLPNNDRVLGGFSGAGRRWPKVRHMALRGFILCSDGRLYHPVIVEQVMIAWRKRENYRADQERLRIWREKKRAGNAVETQSETHFKTQLETRTESDRQGQGQGQGQKNSKITPLPPKNGGTNGANGHGPKRWEDAAIKPAGEGDRRPDAPCVNGYYLDDSFAWAMEAAGIDPAKSAADWKPVVAWLKDGIEPATIRDAITHCAEWENYRPPRSLAYFDKPVREHHARLR